MEVVVTTSLYSKDNYIKDLIDRNEKRIIKMMKRQENENQRKKIYYRGLEKEKVLMPKLKKVEIFENKILYPSEKKLEEWYKKEILIRFKNLLYDCYNNFEEKINFPVLKIRQMKTRWGVCHKGNRTITLNTQLMNYEDRVIKYVIVHELCHMLHLNHSKNFWQLVAKYCPEYNKIRKILRD